MPNLRSKTWTTTTPANVEDAQYWEDHLISDEAAAKAASSVQSVNSQTPDAAGNVDIVALPAGGTAGQVLTKISSTAGDADWLDPASSGHTIQDASGTAMTQQDVLQFTNAIVTNDSVNSRTVVDCQGEKGDPGDAATVTVGTVTTLPAGSDATVTNAGTTSAAVFNFGIPRGADGQGAGDMTKTDYDNDSAVINAGGIKAYVASQAYSLPTASSSTLGGIKVGTNLSIADGVLSATDTTYSDATQSTSGLMSATDKTKLDGLSVPDELADLTGDVAISGVSNGEFLKYDGTAGKWKNQAVTIPTVNDSTITIQRNGVTVDSFTTNASSSKTINIIDDNWTTASTVANGEVSFSGLDDTQGWGYFPCFWVDGNSTNLNPVATIKTISGAGTASMSVTYETDADNGASCRLRIEK